MVELEKVKENVWEIPKTGEMNVPGRVYASEELLKQIKQDKTLQQIKNVAHLPGIQKYSIAMPDAHQGYGFPIGGVAALDVDKGGISPGGVGYDINCLSGDSEVLLEFGRRRKIKNLKSDFPEQNAVVASDRKDSSSIQLLTENEKVVYEVVTQTGENIKASADHEFKTPRGMKRLSQLKEGDYIYIHPFEGLEDEKPEEFVVLDEDDFGEEDSQLIDFLKDRDLLPLKSTDRELNILLKLVGFHTGDGSFSGEKQTWFYGEPEDLKKIQEDIRKLGIRPSKIYSRDRDHDIDGKTFKNTEHSVRSTSRAFRKLLIKLGSPEGEKVEKGFTTPDYLEKLTDWQKALYLSAFFGAEMSSPAPQTDKNLYAPTVSHNRIEGKKENAKQFMMELKTYLKKLGIRTNGLEVFEANSRDRMLRFRFGIKNDTINLIKFFTRLGYRYSLSKQKEAIKAALYLKGKLTNIKKRDRIAKKALAMYGDGAKPKVIKQSFDINERFIERSVYGNRKTGSRPSQDFPDYREFTEKIDVEDNLTVKVPISSVERKGKEPVYDIGVKHSAHNFIGNSFVVSNCGVRLVKTPLKAGDVKPKMKELINTLFQKIPSGVGSSSQLLSLSKDELKDVIENGAEWAVENGYGMKEDLKHMEEEGRMGEADASVISEKALNRGKEQVGSLGSGNHFLEVEKVGKIDNRGAAKNYGLEEDQICIMIHTGSRGFGHQVCTDYLRETEKKYKDIVRRLPDKELVYAPGGSEMANRYFKAMSCGVNFAFTNRQIIMHQTRKAFQEVFGLDYEDMKLVYGVCHNIAKKEEHNIDGTKKEAYVHRKGATRAFPPGHDEIPDDYRDTGQPVMIPGNMGTGSYLLRGKEESMNISFGSTAHGSGRTMSRTKAKNEFWGETVQNDLKNEGILVKAASMPGVAEEAPGAYKSLENVVNVSHDVGVAEKVLKLDPMGVIKG
ncbi:MAG: RtcB family protein [Candidatus Aenigmatarchaeota archaeon]